MKQSLATEALILAATNRLGGECDGEFLRFQDSFGTLALPLTPKGLMAPDGSHVSRLSELCALMVPAAGANEAGLTRGTLLTPLGIMEFDVVRTQVAQHRPAWEFRCKLWLERETRIRNVALEAVEIYGFQRDEHVSSYGDSSHIRDVGGRGWRGYGDTPPSLNALLTEVRHQAKAALLTRAALHAAQETEIKKRIEAAAAAVRDAQVHLTALQGELAQHVSTVHPSAA